MHVLIFQHIHVEHPGSLRDQVRQHGVKWGMAKWDEGETPPGPDGYDVLMVTGRYRDRLVCKTSLSPHYAPCPTGKPGLPACGKTSPD